MMRDAGETAAPPIEPVRTEDFLALYDASKYFTAWQRLEPAGGLDALQAPAGRALAGRLANNLGAERLGRAIHWRAWQREPDVESLGYYAAMALMHFRGPVAALKLTAEMQRDGLSTTAQADILAAETFQLMVLHDYERAEQTLAAAHRIARDHAWLGVVRGQLFAAQDRSNESLAAYQDVLCGHAYYRPAVQATAETLTKLDRIDEARELLIDAAEHIESGSVLLQLAQIERELGEFELARERLRAAEPLLPLRHRDRYFRKSFAGMLATAAADCGDIDEAITYARAADNPYHTAIADQLAEHGRTGKRVVLNVGFTLQHDVTCVPATLSTLTKFWQMPIAHLDIAEAICYDGTPAQAEREWLEKQGFFCREFTLTWDATRALIDAGIPFTQTIVGYGMGHMQAVIGYDSRRGVLIIRDPNYRQATEIPAKELIERMRSSGPRGLVFVPQKDRALVEAIDLPDAGLWDAHYEFSRRLDQHDRAGAWKAFERMAAAAPEHRLTTFGRARIAWYDGDHHVLRECTDKLLAAFPTDQNQWSVKIRLLRENGTRDERLRVLGDLNQNRDCQSVFRHQYIDELLEDATKRDEVRRLMRRHLHTVIVDGHTYSLMGRMLWTDGQREEALTWFRYAACLDDKDESRAMTYFSAARVLNRTDEAMQMLRDRRDRFGQRSSGPARSLAEAYDQLDQPQLAVGVIEDALTARPDDNEFKLYAADFLSRIGRALDAQRLLRESRAKCHPAAWHFSAARFSLAQNRLEQAREHLQQSLNADPLNLATHNMAADVLADLGGNATAFEELKKWVERFPENLGLRTLLVQRAAELDQAQREAEIRALLALHPHDAWNWRELGFCLVEQRKWREAHVAATRAHAIEPDAEPGFRLFGMIFRGLGKHDKAYQAMLRAVRLSPDSPHAILELMKLCDTLAERRTALGHVLNEMKRQTIRGDSLAYFAEHAARTFEPPELLRMLLESHKARPDLWQTWSVLVRQLVAMKRTDDALKYARKAAEKFSLLPAPLVDLADVYQERGQQAEERAALERALTIDSRNCQTLRRAAEAYRRAGDADREQAALERACATEPRNVTHQGALAELLWTRGNRPQAIDAIETAIRREPRYEWGWRQLSNWAWTIGEPKRVKQLAEELTKSRPDSPEMWLQFARILSQSSEDYAECLRALDRATELDASLIDAHELRAIILTEHGDFDAALAACRPKSLGGRQPLQLTSRAASIAYHRGDRRGAIEQMRRITEQDPRAASPWSKLADWLKEDGQFEEAVECAKRMTEISPDSPVSWGYAADCLLALGKRDEAVLHLRRSIQLDPSYIYGGQTLLTIQLENNEYTAAIDTLRIFGPHLSQAERYAKETRVYCLAGRFAESLKAFQSACEASHDTPDELLDAADALLQAGQGTNVKEVLLRSLDRSESSPQLAAVAVEIMAREGALRAVDEFCGSLDAATDHWAAAMGAYIGILGEAEAPRKLVGLIAHHDPRLRHRNETWGAVGSALQRCGLYERARDWLSDWHERRDLKTSMLVPLAVSHVALDEPAAALVVAKAAGTLPVGPPTEIVRLMAACAEVINDNPLAAGEWLASVRPAQLTPYNANLLEIVKRACDLLWRLDEGARWQVVEGQWLSTLKEKTGPLKNEFTCHIIARCEQMLRRRRANTPYKWLADRRARQSEKKRQRSRQAYYQSITQ